MIFFKKFTKLNISIVSWFNERREREEVVLGMRDLSFLKIKRKLKTNQCCIGAQMISAGNGNANKEGYFKNSISNQVPI